MYFSIDKRWTNTIIEELEKHGEIGKDILRTCGRGCFDLSGMAEGLKGYEAELANITNIEELVDLLNKTIFNKYKVSVDNDNILIDYGLNQCMCPIVMDGEITNSFMCNCSCGFTKELFSTIFGKEVEVEIVESVLSGADSCKHQVVVSL